MAAFEFVELSANNGVDALARPVFMAVPWKGRGFIGLRSDKKAALEPDRHIEASDMTDDPMLRTIDDFVAAMGGLPMAAKGIRFVSIKGNTPGPATLTARLGKQTAKLDIGVLRSKTFSIAFRFLRHRDAADPQQTAGTSFKPADAQGMVDGLNSVYGPQANIAFTLANAQMVEIDSVLPQPVDDQVKDDVMVPRIDKDADITAFLVGKWWHGRLKGSPNGSHYGLAGGKHLVVMNDKPSPVSRENLDWFLVTLAHEVGHSIGGGHQARNRVLLADADHAESLKIDKELLKQLNSWNADSKAAKPAAGQSHD